MKKQLSILATVFISVAFVSCRKEKIEKDQASKATPDQISATNFSSTDRTVVDPLTVNLEGRFEFDNNLKEKSGKLPEGIPTTRGVAGYGADRKGNSKRALFLDGNYGVKLSNVPQQTNTSLSVWLFAANSYDEGEGLPVYGRGPTIYHSHTVSWFDHFHSFSGGVILQTQTNNNPFIGIEYNTGKSVWGGWHHFAVTYNGNSAMFYIDGNLIGSNNDYPSAITPGRQNYQLGFGHTINGFWAGGIDDLRFYSRTLSAADVQKLYNL